MRSFHPFSKMNPRHSLAFWFLGNLSPVGDMPYLALPALGYDQRGRAGRGYTQEDIADQIISMRKANIVSHFQCGGIWGGVIFVNANTADKPDRSVRLFDYVVPGYGFGLRLMVDKHSGQISRLTLGLERNREEFISELRRRFESRIENRESRIENRESRIENCES
jgi:hypothetical protein